ncbi:MAG: hypothetical protein WA624_16115 [Methylocella sp.]
MCGFIDAQRPAENGVTPRGPISTVVSLNCKKKLPNFLPYRGNAKAWLEQIGKANSRKRQSSFATIAQRAEEVAGRFYANLFAAHPEFRPLFRNDMAAQTKMLIFILGSAVRGLNRMQEQVGGLRALGEQHLDYGVKRANYSPPQIK